MVKKGPGIFPRSESLTSTVNRILDGKLPSERPKTLDISENQTRLRIKSTVSPEAADAYLGEQFGATIVSDPSGDHVNDLLFIVHGEEKAPTDECLTSFGSSVLNNAARRRIKRFMVVSGPYNPEPVKHRRAIPLLYKGVSAMMRRDSEQEPSFRGIVVPMDEKYAPYGQSSLALFNIKARTEAISHRVRQAFSSGQSFPNDISFTLGRPLNSNDPQDTALAEALYSLDIIDLATIMRVKRHLKKILSKCALVEGSTYLREEDLDNVL